MSSSQDIDGLRPTEQYFTDFKQFRSRRKPFTKDEDLEIIAWIVKYQSFYLLRGNAIWKMMEKKVSENNRTWQSLQNRFNESIFPNVESYNLPVKVVEKIKRGFTGVESPDPRDSSEDSVQSGGGRRTRSQYRVFSRRRGPDKDKRTDSSVSEEKERSHTSRRGGQGRDLSWQGEAESGYWAGHSHSDTPSHQETDEEDGGGEGTITREQGTTSRDEAGEKDREEEGEIANRTECGTTSRDEESEEERDEESEGTILRESRMISPTLNDERLLDLSQLNDKREVENENFDNISGIVSPNDETSYEDSQSKDEKQDTGKTTAHGVDASTIQQDQFYPEVLGSNNPNLQHDQISPRSSRDSRTTDSQQEQFSPRVTSTRIQHYAGLCSDVEHEPVDQSLSTEHSGEEEADRSLELLPVETSPSVPIRNKKRRRKTVDNRTRISSDVMKKQQEGAFLSNLERKESLVGRNFVGGDHLHHQPGRSQGLALGKLFQDCVRYLPKSSPGTEGTEGPRVPTHISQWRELQLEARLGEGEEEQVLVLRGLQRNFETLIDSSSPSAKRLRIICLDTSDTEV